VNISHISSPDLRHQLRRTGIYIRTGPFIVHLKTPLPTIANALRLLYKDFRCESPGFADFHVSLSWPRNFRRWWRPQVVCYLDDESPFTPLPADQSFVAFESLLNWSIYSRVYHFLILHAAAVERAGLAVILPAPPGSGKSTLCAALVSRGWHLLTDELTLIDLDSGLAVPMPRPISLKNQSIDVMQAFAPKEGFGEKIYDTVKGTIAHMRPPTESVLRMHNVVAPRWIIFPKYRDGALMRADHLSKGQAFMRLSGGLVNYPVLGARGFETLTRLIDQTDCYDFTYSELDDAIGWFNRLYSRAQA
jgi:hypothetical protein